MKKAWCYFREKFSKKYIYWDELRGLWKHLFCLILLYSKYFKCRKNSMHMQVLLLIEYRTELTENL